MVSFVLVTIIVGALVVVDMFAALNLGRFLFSPWFVIPALLRAFVVAPFVVAHIPYTRNEHGDSK